MLPYQSRWCRRALACTGGHREQRLACNVLRLRCVRSLLRGLIPASLGVVVSRHIVKRSVTKMHELASFTA
eukprot:705860-Amphidinium_carterae.1